MVTRTEIILYDDLEYYTNQAKEIDAQETVKFAFQGAEYEIDLCDKNVGVLAEFLATYMHAGRRINEPKKVTPVPKSRKGREATTKRNILIREWAKGEGYNVQNNGRIPTAIIAEYERAHS